VALGMAMHDNCKHKFFELKVKQTHQVILYKIAKKLKHVVVEKDR